MVGGDWQVAAVEAAEAQGLQPVAPFITKVIQLYETFNVRFGVMLVGPTGGGKTCCYRVLASAMASLHARRNPDPNFQPVHTAVLNPKAIGMGELYGEYNLMTNEWSDGLGSSLIRSAVTDVRQDRHWVVFDGPVDAVWVENMNTGERGRVLPPPPLHWPSSIEVQLNPGRSRNGDAGEAGVSHVVL